MRFVTYEHDGLVRHGMLDPGDASGETIRMLGGGGLLDLLERDGLAVAGRRASDAPALELHLDVNGDVRQHGSTADMLFGVAELISFSSRIMTLEPGDIILTGTPAGAGVETGKVFLEVGDVMTARVGDLGEIRNRIIAPGG